MIKAICFDLDGVFFTEDSFPRFKQTVAELTEYPQLVDDVFHGSVMNNFKMNNINEGEYWDYARDTLEITLTNEEISKILRKSYSVDQDILDYVCKVKDTGYKTCLCSNNFVTRINELEKEFAFLKYFDIQIFSFDVGVLKPHVNIFKALVEQSKVDVSEIVYSDDRESKLDGAKELGIHTFIFKNIEQFKHTLESFGVIMETN
ncbi:MAG: HAD-IA family hydrolase [Thermodesulfobacteriota bacterium]